VSETFWVDGTRSTIHLDGTATQGRLSVLEETLPHGPGPPLHSHPQGETFCVLDGELLLWTVPAGNITRPIDRWPPELLKAAERCGPGDVRFVPGGSPHTYAVPGEAARILVISTPAGLELWTREFGVPVTDDGLAPSTGAAPAISADRRRRFARVHGLRSLGPPPP
jgi:quercetin dioxygenase-like cupin family protein